MPCRAHLGEVQKRYEDIRRLDGEVLAVALTRPELLAAHLGRHPLPFPMVADPEGSAYRALGLGRTSWAEILRPGVVIRYLGLILRGWLPRRPNQGEDVLQLGGDFVLDGGGRLVYAYRSANPADRPAVEELLQAVRAAAARVPG